MAQDLLKSKHSTGEKPKVSTGAWRLLLFMLFVFVVFLLSYFGLVFGYKPFVNAQINSANEKIAQLESEIPQIEQDEFLQFQFQLRNLRTILNNHKGASGIISTLEQNTNQLVLINDFKFDTLENRLGLEGTAASYEIFAQQLSAFEKMSEVIRYQVGFTKLKEGGLVDFGVSLFLNESVSKL